MFAPRFSCVGGRDRGKASSRSRKSVAERKRGATDGRTGVCVRVLLV
jgi:hypothetical protein